MELINCTPGSLLSSQLKEYIGKSVCVHGMVHKVRILSKAVFIQLMDAAQIIQCVAKPEMFRLYCENSLKTGDWVIIEGLVIEDHRAKAGIELHTKRIEILNEVGRKGDHEIVANVILANGNPVSNEPALNLRNPKKRSILKIKGMLQAGFTDFFISHDFTQINSPKIIFNGLEGGSNLFSLDFFGRRGFLSQSPQLYKQMMTGVFQRVFEIGPVFRANENRGSKQLNEFIALDVEFSPVKNLSDISSCCISAIKHAISYVKEKCVFELDIMGVTMPEISITPLITQKEALEIIGSGKTEIDQGGKELLSRHFLGLCKSEFLFIANPPLKDCNFYFMEDSEHVGHGKCWHLLLNGLDIGGGGQRIHLLDEQKIKMEKLGMNTSDFSHYLAAHRYGLPPHGGFSISIERLVMKLLNLANIRETSIFPLDADSKG